MTSSTSSSSSTSTSSSQTNNQLPTSFANIDLHAKTISSAKAAMDNAAKNMAIAEQQLAANTNGMTNEQYQKMRTTYYRASRRYHQLVTQKRYYTSSVIKIKTRQTLYVYSTKQFNHQKRIKKIKAGTVLTIKQVVGYRNITRLSLGNHRYITSNKSLVTKA